MNSGNAVAALVMLAVLGLGASPGLAEDADNRAPARSGAEWLEFMASSAENLHYSGTFIHSEDGGMKTLRVVHRADPDGPRERLVSLTGGRQEILRDRGKVRCIHEEDKQGQRDLRHTAARFFAHLAEDGVSRFEEYYQILDLGQDRVAGRDCQVIGLKPNDDLRYGLRFWIDTATGMPLRTDLVDADGDTRKKVMFTEFRHRDEIADAELEPELDEGTGRYATRKASLRKPESGSLDHPGVSKYWGIDGLPAGYRVHVADGDGYRGHSKLHHLIVTDGVSRISIFAEPLEEDGTPMEGLSRMGSTNAYARVLNGYQLTVVGEAPAAAVRRIAEAVNRVPEGAGDEE